jgi:tight adherence protein C
LSLERALTALAEDPETGRQTAFRRQLLEVVREIRAGVSCESALNRWGELTQVEEVMALASAAERSRALGVPLAAGLARQASIGRDRLRQEYLGWANALPSRLSLCAMLFFLPAILIVVLLPSVLSFLRSGW